MKTYYSSLALDPNSLVNSAGNAVSGSVVAIGNFDGVHLGHQTILESARAIALRLDPAEKDHCLLRCLRLIRTQR